MTQSIRRLFTNNKRLSILALALVLIGSGIGSLAVLSDTLTVTTTYSVLTVDLKANGQQSVTQTLNFDGTGDTTVAALLTMSNAGNTEFRYAARATASGSLNAKAYTDFWNLTGANPTADCASLEAGTAPTTATKITSYSTMQELGAAGFGDPAAGQQTGDQILAAGATQNLCMVTRKVTTATLTGTDTASQTVTFSAEQTAP